MHRISYEPPAQKETTVADMQPGDIFQIEPAQPELYNSELTESPLAMTHNRTLVQLANPKKTWAPPHESIDRLRARRIEPGTRVVITIGKRPS